MEHSEMQNFPCFISRRNLIKGDLQRRNTNNMKKDKEERVFKLVTDCVLFDTHVY